MIPETASQNLIEEVVLLKKQISSLQDTLKNTQEQLEWLKRQLFGKRTEKIVVPVKDKELTLFDLVPLEGEDSSAEKTPVTPHKRKKPDRNGKNAITLSPDIPVERQIIDLPESEKICPETGVPLIKIGEEITKKLVCRPGSYYIKEIVRPKYAHPQKSENGIAIAPIPESLLDRCIADDSFLADIITKKFADHQPLNRQCEQLARQGVEISKQTLCQWILRAGKALEPLYEAMMQKIIKSNNLFVDEVPIDMLSPGKGKVQQVYIWVMAGGCQRDPPYRVYKFYPDRKHRNAEDLITGSNNPVFHSDKYGAYEKLANAGKIIWCPCWAHIRRKFFEAESGDPDFRKWILRKIRHLFMLERVAWNRSETERLQILTRKRSANHR